MGKSKRAIRDRIAVEQLQQAELQFPGLIELCASKSIDRILPQRKPVSPEAESSVTLLGMHIAEPLKRKA